MKLKMEKRINKIGQMSQGIIIPKIWLDYHEMGVGDRIQLIEDDECNLVIVPIKNKKKSGGKKHGK